jgi:hypothetical protein
MLPVMLTQGHYNQRYLNWWLKLFGKITLLLLIGALTRSGFRLIKKIIIATKG